MTSSLELPLRPSYFWNFNTLYSEGYGFKIISTAYGGLCSMVAAESFSCLVRSLMSEHIRSMAGSLVTLAGSLAAERLSALLGVSQCSGSLDINSVIGVLGAGAGFPISSGISQVFPVVPVVAPSR